MFLHEEFFGPVALMASYKTENQFVDSINHSSFGLGAALFAKDTDKALQSAKQLDVGMIAINASIRSDVRVPFGGVRNSGYGKELGIKGLQEFCNFQFVGVD
jgi:acyl-CoA reductase-like NAD-dependent aldehyde dehydrogenase